LRSHRQILDRFCLSNKVDERQNRYCLILLFFLTETISLWLAERDERDLSNIALRAAIHL
jgi:hypothetical protein